jgi:uncharacterized membrane protein
MYRWMSIVSMIVLILCLGIPHFAESFQLTRFYALTIIFLAPFFVIGGETVFNRLKKELTPFMPKSFPKLGFSSGQDLMLKLVSVILIASFLFNIGLIDHIAGTYPESISLDHDKRKLSDQVSMKVGYYYFFLTEQDVQGAIWLSEHRSDTLLVYSDQDSTYLVLLSYGLIPLNQSFPLLTYPRALQAGYVYLRTLNVDEGIVASPAASNLTDISSALDLSNKIYSNGGSEIYSSPGV